MNTFKKFGIAAGATVVAFAPLLSHAQVSTSSIGTLIDKETNSLLGYVELAIDKFWPIILGLALIVAVWLVGKRIYSYLHNG